MQFVNKKSFAYEQQQNKYEKKSGKCQIDGTKREKDEENKKK